MKPEKWERIKELFGLALEREPNQRADFLEQACGGDETLRVEVESLLASQTTTESGRIVESFPPGPLEAPAFEAKEAGAGRRIGSYQIVREIGRGGMAAVYLAMRADDQYRKRVAIKLVKPGLDSEEILRRFRNERQTLAALDHPNIVKLLDGGSTEQGLPYLVMEYVEGMRIDEYCDSRRLSITERLQLFRTICAAVYYAHQNMVIHRDLKPGNILVTSEGIPKLLDFGIAKLLNPEFSSQSLLVTQLNVRPMTLEYASPEQVRGLPITGATDIYSLGVVLYELLTGHRPYRLTRQTPLEIERVICEEEPEKPSTVVTHVEAILSPDGTAQTTVTPETVSRTREGRPEKLRRRLHGDLDNIVLMALRKEPQRRYASVEQFAEDMRRHLEGLPVRARKNTVIYRGSKFIRRRKIEIAAVSSFLLALVVLVMGLELIGWRGLTRTGTIAGTEQAALATPPRLRRSVAVLGFKNLGARPEEAWLSGALSEELSTELVAGEQLRTIPGEDVDQVKKELSLADSESYSAATLQRIHRILRSDYAVVGSYLALGSESGGEVRLDLRVQDTAAGDTIASVSETGTEARLPDLVSRVGAVVRAKLGAAEPSAEEAIRARASLSSNPEATRLYSEGLAKLRRFDAPSARNLLEEAVAAEPDYALAHSALAAAWWAMGYELRAQGEARKAFELSVNLPREQRLLVEGRYHETLHEWSKAIDIYKALTEFFPDDLEYGLLLANAQASAGKGKDALETIAALRKLSEPSRDDARIDVAEAVAQGSLGSHQRAQEAAARAAEEGNSQGRRLIVAQARYLEGQSFAHIGNHAKARAALEEARQLYMSVEDRGHMARVQNVLGLLAWQEGDLAGAIKMYRESLTAAREIGDQRDIAVALNNSALVLWQRGDFGAAERIFRELVAVNQEIGNRANEALAEYNLGLVLWDQGELSKTREVQEKSLITFREIGQKSYIIQVQSFLGLVLMTQGDLANARKMVEEALAMGRELGEKRNVTPCRIILARLAGAEKRWPEAEKLANEAAEDSRAEKFPDFEAYARAMLSQALLEQGKLAEAKTQLEEALAVSQEIQDPHVRFNVGITAARVKAAAGNPTAAIQDLKAIITDAVKAGLVVLQFDGRLALGEIEIKSGNIADARTVLLGLEKDARAKGFGLIARRAAEMRRRPDQARASHSP